MTDTTHDIDALVKTADAIVRHPSMGGAMANAQDVLSDMSAALTALQVERDAWKARADLPPTLSSALAVPEVTVMWHALLTWDAAHRTGKNEPLQVAFELGQSALAGLKGNNNV